MLESLIYNKIKVVPDSEDIKFINLFLLGILTYSFGSGLLTAEFIHPIFCNFIQFIGLGMFIIAMIFLIDFSIYNFYLRILFFIYLAYLLSIIFRGFTLDYSYIKNSLFNQNYGVFIYFTPLVLLIPISTEYLKRIFVALKIFSILFLIFFVLKIPILLGGASHEGQIYTESYSRTLGIVSGFLLLTFPFHSNKTIIVALSTMMSILLIAIYQGRRGLAIYCLIILIFASIIYLAKGKNISIILVLASMFLAIVAVFGMDRITNSGFLGTLMERGLDDTRSNVETRFYEDMEKKDWIFGRGINGEYYCPGIIWGDGDPSIYRSIIETDFLQIILKGGLISLGLLMLILVPAGLIGILRSNNLLATAAGLWIIIGIINMYPSTVNTFTFNYLLVWISVRICFSSTIRNLSNKELILLLKPNVFKQFSLSKSL